ncbi:CinA family nicotinamide mononucleotide deamidase-related protein [Salsipaludibacter albus]|uniref:CinA family nicotinamide mononucleotide deamidase-related protein n=1 Tax=Salsipaludibacter albus TaxID=2849650 RepID=UPI001EE47F4A|nr:CinA family nicotinamide mononucleotide deamidase-related protein [Salsipaludibacter albus]MBY5163502.1 CinA family nicotinamide mononucleotide deamidase-related protein [Salsipaludibacter albus]
MSPADPGRAEAGPSPRAAIVSVGTEIVGGDQVDTNAAWLARRLRSLGVRPRLTVAVSDDLDELVDGLELALARADVVVVGGGLGPTSDDRTREAVAQVTGRALSRRPELVEAIEDRFASFDRRMPPSNRVQADLPEGAVAMPPVGTAPGFSLSIDEVDLHVLPGVPWELRALFDRHVADPVAARSGGRRELTRVVHVAGLGESDVAEALADVEAAAVADHVEVAYLATRGGIRVRFTAAGHDRDDVAARAGAAVDAAVGVLGTAVVGLDHDGLEVAVVRALEAAGRTVAVAESATGGLVLTRLTDVPGVSAVLRGGAVVYATETKATVAGIDPALLDAHPAVSEPVTEALAVAVRARFGADLGVATTAVAGPDEQDGVAVGTAVWAVADEHGSAVWSRHLPGDRSAVRDRLASAAIDAIRRRLASS